MQIEMQRKKISNFSKVFRAFLEKVVFSNLKPVNIFEWNFQEGFLIDIHLNEGLVDKPGHHLMPAMPIFQKQDFFEKGPKSQQFLKKNNFFLHFL